MSFQVTILGAGAALPTLNQNPTSQYICCNDRHILIDCGEGTQTQLRKLKIHFQKINHILISHLHGDHFFGLVGLLSSLHLLGRTKPMYIYGPALLEQIVRLQLEVGGARLNYELHFTPLTGKENTCLFEDRLLEIWTFPLNHRVPTNGFLIKEKQKERRLNAELFEEAKLSLTMIPALKRGEKAITEDGIVIDFETYTFPPTPPKSYAYCSDTKYDERVIPFIQSADLLYHEATFCNEHEVRAKQTFHSTAAQAATIASKAGVKKLLLGHLSSRYDDGLKHQEEASAIFNCVEVVEEGKRYDV